MINPCRLKHFSWLGHAVIILFFSLTIISGCAYPATDVPGLTTIEVFPNNSSNALPTIGTPISISSSPPPIVQVSQTAPPTTAPVDPTPIPMPPDQVPAQYTLEAIFNYGQHTLVVNEAISYLNLASDTLTDIQLIIEPNLVPGGFTLVSISWDDGTKIDQFSLRGNLMQIPLLQPLQPSEQMGIHMKYQLDIPALGDATVPGRPEAYGYSERQTNLVDWYPYAPPYVDGSGWLVHSIWNFGEYQVYDEADFRVDITLDQPVKDLVLAASAPAVQEGTRYSYQLLSARTFALSASTEYLVQTTTIGEITVFSYSFPYDESAGRQVLSDTAEAVQIYSEVIYPYPHTSLSIVEADFLDGMEYDGLYFLSHGFYDVYDGTNKGYLTFIGAHETAHQWWYGLVSNDQALEPWLDEAMSTYMEHIYYEFITGDYQPHHENTLVDWWWSYRINFYEPQGWVDSSIYDLGNSRAYRNAIYLNGAKFLDDLRNLIGDEAFFTFLKDYASTHAHKIVTADDFFTIVRKETNQDLDPLISSYFNTSQ